MILYLDLYWITQCADPNQCPETEVLFSLVREIYFGVWNIKKNCVHNVFLHNLYPFVTEFWYLDLYIRLGKYRMISVQPILNLDKNDRRMDARENLFLKLIN